MKSSKLVSVLASASAIGLALFIAAFAVGTFAPVALGIATVSMVTLFSIRDYAPRSSRFEPRASKITSQTSAAYRSNLRLAA